MVIWSLPADDYDGYVVCGSSALAHLGSLPGCVGVVTVDLASPGADLFETLRRQHPDHSLVAIPADDAGCDFLALTQTPTILTAPVASARTLAILRDKWSFYGLCRQLDLPTPPTAFLGEKSGIDIKSLFGSLGDRIVIKPTNLHGGQGVVVVESADELRTKVLDNPDYRYGSLLGQSWVPGRDLSLNLLALDGELLHWAIQNRQGREMVFLGHDGLLEAARTLVAHLAFSGLANIDARLDAEGQIYLLECNPRPWASLGQSTWAGLNFIQAALDLATGLASRQPPQLNEGVAPDMIRWWFMEGWKPGRWRALPATRKRMVRGAILTFMSLGWADRLRKIRIRFGLAPA